MTMTEYNLGRLMLLALSTLGLTGATIALGFKVYAIISALIG